MKIRTGFVSNSSSASFVIDARKLTELQVLAIRDHINVGSKMGVEYADEDDQWDIREDEDDGKIYLSTSMDNFNMDEFLSRIGAAHAIIDRDHS